MADQQTAAGADATRLYFHLGTEKTGSSFLQSAFALNREHLAAQCIWFPAGKRWSEAQMRKGDISAGNGEWLLGLLQADDWPGVQAYLAHVLAQARAAGCGQLVYSSELLLPLMAEPERIGRLHRMLASMQVASVSVLVFLREPVSQILSLYRHRAKRGTAGSFSAWAETGYSLPAELAGLDTGLAAAGWKLQARAYRRDPAHLLAACFRDWLGLEPPAEWPRQPVNPSLTLSEVELLRHFRTLDPLCVSELHASLVAVPEARKPPAGGFERRLQAQAAAIVQADADFWKKWLARLPADEHFVIPSVADDDTQGDPALSLGSAQLQALVESLSRASRPTERLKLRWQHSIRPQLGRLARAILPERKPW
ncbi:MAG: hypothetical protein JJU31_08750 [Wenzhouxiangella sp.]|nr:hypothetical protein [Wenzhouxiangella sp.]